MKEIKYIILYCVFVRTFVILFYYGSGRFRLFDKLRFRFHMAKSSYSSGSGSTKLFTIRANRVKNKVEKWAQPP
jgi:hypothetical protein